MRGVFTLHLKECTSCTSEEVGHHQSGSKPDWAMPPAPSQMATHSKFDAPEWILLLNAVCHWKPTEKTKAIMLRVAIFAIGEGFWWFVESNLFHALIYV